MQFYTYTAHNMSSFWGDASTLYFSLSLMLALELIKLEETHYMP